MGTATVQAQVWGVRARDWAEVQEGTFLPLFERVLDQTAVRSGSEVLDIGCGSGLFCELAARRGALVSGLDASEALLAIAQERTPQGDFRTGDMEELPYAAATFDLVTGFNSFQFAADPVNALRQARARHTPRRQAGDWRVWLATGLRSPLLFRCPGIAAAAASARDAGTFRPVTGWGAGSAGRKSRHAAGSGRADRYPLGVPGCSNLAARIACLRSWDARRRSSSGRMPPSKPSCTPWRLSRQPRAATGWKIQPAIRS